MTYQITSNYFVAGIVFNQKIKVEQAAPIVKYMVGWGMESVQRYCDTRRWKLEKVE